ncbi:GDSL-type esterase/lipase family protein [Singulisphaera acidiphila]|uniref:Lysophospholipase L1-like esterase n=1 Tax=Singulisphaera acidiphila (strain ATCC BAA-1392 / DSM 18658 / VKM B-2454 / MOB10) TaxID=886293 RepID=L0DBK1_SINAD|nr:GDSL-type esterase/lipase family protein [Singulisphaera acidiphila]AGA26754.1 lysophospholipase L1-like esterase [Singulisphaera acidiphila DSM 18658]
MIPTRRPTAGLAAWLFLLTIARAETPPAPPSQTAPALTVVTLGDSITKGVRDGVRPEETFAALAERALKAKGINVRVVNLGVGGERTDQALKRLDAIAEPRPQVVTVMYGTNDSYVDPGKDGPRIALGDFRKNLKAIVEGLLLRGIDPVLMTAPREAENAPLNGLGENRNLRLAPFMAACREVAKECRVPLVDHFARWTDAEAKGQSLKEWTTDGYHPNPIGHQDLANAIIPALLEELRPNTPRVPFTTRLDTVLEHDDGKFLWYHPRVTAIPRPDAPENPNVLMTLQKHLNVSDHYSGLSVMRSKDLGRTWTGPDAVAELDWVRAPGDVDVAVADVTPGWHPATGKVLAVGAQVRYSQKGEQLEDQHRSNQTAYAVFDPDSGRWTPWRRLEMPAGESFHLARSACAQFVVEPDGSVLLPFYIGRSAEVPYAVTMVRCGFDGDKLVYREQGNVLTLDVARGLYEPSLIRAGGRYFLTIRNDLKGYVTASDDGLHYRPVKAWTFDDGQELGSYNTQQHWLAHGGGLFLVYTRRGANNDHIIRHRAPLFLAQLDPIRLSVIRETERVVVPERGAELGNFGAAAINDRESWITVSEGLWDKSARERGAKGALFVARVFWEEPKSPVLKSTREALEGGKPVQVVCFGDSVTGVYYHTGGRRAYTDMLGIALRRTYPTVNIVMTNAGISGHTTRDALARIDRDVLRHKPTLVTVMFGLNDVARLPLEEYRKNLGEIVAQCQRAGVEVLLCTPNNVITTGDRPTPKLLMYCDVVREVGQRLNVPVCDVYAELEAQRERDGLAWRLGMSDEIHPNMDGHKRIAETISHAMTGKAVTLADVPLLTPFLPRTAARLKEGQPIRIIAMPPFDGQIRAALKAEAPDAKVEVTPWPMDGKTLSELEQDAKLRIRPATPDLVVIAVPRTAKPGARESFIHDYAWLMNWSLSFGLGGWDCVVVHPSVTAPDHSGENDPLIRQLVRAQDLPLIDRLPGDDRTADELLRDWFRRQPWRE